MSTYGPNAFGLPSVAGDDHLVVERPAVDRVSEGRFALALVSVALAFVVVHRVHANLALGPVSDADAAVGWVLACALLLRRRGWGMTLLTHLAIVLAVLSLALTFDAHGVHHLAGHSGPAHFLCRL